MLARELAPIVGRRWVSISTEDRVLASYDATREKAMPDVVVKPATAQEISQILRYANAERVPVVPRGAASGLTGGALPVRGGIVLDFQRMNRVLNVDETNFIANLEPGVIVGEFQREIEKRGLFFPPDPASADFATIGGCVAECAGGLRAVKYGVTRDYVLALEVVLPTGEIIHTGARTLKSVTGYDLTRFFIGSEGTLGIFTRITVRLIPLPETFRSLLACFGSAEEAGEASAAILARRVLPRAIEFMDRRTIWCVRQIEPEHVPESAAALLLVDVDGDDASTRRALEVVEEACREQGAEEIHLAMDPQRREALWAVRRAISPALFRLAPNKLNEDVCVLPSMVPELLRRLEKIEQKHGLYIANYGHIGDGNIHVTIMYPDGKGNHHKAHVMASEVMKETVDLGGTLSGEHGCGTRKAEFLSLEIPPTEMALMRSLKELLDPNGILNPGKVFPETQ